MQIIPLQHLFHTSASHFCTALHILKLIMCLDGSIFDDTSGYHKVLSRILICIFLNQTLN